MKQKTLKNCLVLILTLVLFCALSVTAVVAAAESSDSVTIKCTDFDPAPGQEFTTTLYVAENSNLVGLDLELSYDTDILTLVDYEELKAVCSAGDGIISVHYATTTAETKELKLIKLTFLVDDSLSSGLYDNWIVWSGKGTDEITAYAGLVGGKPQYSDLSCSMDLCSLFIRSKGDAYNNSNDGKVNSRDAVYILQYAAHMFEMPLTDKQYANVYEDYEDDGNGNQLPKVNTRDATKILQYAAHMDVVLDDRCNISFYDIDENGNYVLQVVKSVAKGESLLKIPSILRHDGYENGVWSLEPASSSAEAVAPDFSNITENISVYAVYDHTGKTPEGYSLYNQVVEAIDNVFMEEGKYIADDFQLPYKNAKAVYNMPSYADYDVTWKTESGLLAQGLSVINYIVDVPQLDYTTWVRFTATVSIDQINYGTVSFDRELKGTIDLPSPDAFKKIVDDVPSEIPEDYRLPGYVSLESGRLNYGVSIVQNVDIKWTLIDGNEKGYDARNYGFIHLKDENPVTLKAEFVFDGRVVASYMVERTIPAKSLEGQKEYAKAYLKTFVPTTLSGYYLFPTDVERYDFSVNWYSSSASGKFDFSKGNATYNNGIYQQIGVGPQAGYMESGYLTARIEREGAIVDEFTFVVQLAGDSDVVDQSRFGDEKLYNALLNIFGIDDGEGGKKLTERSLSGYGEIESYINKKAVENYQASNNALDLSGLELRSIKGIQYVTSVKSLDLSNNDLGSDTNGLEYLASLTKLEQLNLSHCNIDIIPSSTFVNMYNIEGIDLSHNNLTNLNFLAVNRSLYSLSDVFAHDNDLSDISGLVYSNGSAVYSSIPNVKRLTLNRKADSQNEEAVLDISPLTYADNLVVLWLANHNISDISALSSLKYLETLDLSNNEIYAPNATTDGLLPIAKLTNLKKLVLDNNRITTIRSLRKLVNLEFLSMAGNTIGNLGASLSNCNGIVVLNLNNNELTTFDASSFPTLSYLYLENNRLSQLSGLSALAPDAESGKYGLVDLRLNGNVIDSGIEDAEDLSLPLISQLTNLEYLSLNGNNVGKLEFLKELTQLTHLEIAGANICQLYEVEDYQDPTSGEMVYKTVDNLSNLYGLASLKVLDLSGNEDLTDISALTNASGGLTKLEYLYLDKPLGVKGVEEDGAVIYYQYKPFTNLSSIRRMPRLRALSIQNSGANDLSFVQQIGAIEYLNLSGHAATKVDFVIFNGKENLSTLFLDSIIGSAEENIQYISNLSDVIEAVSFKNISIGNIDKLPDLDNVKYLNLSDTQIADFCGSSELYSIDRFLSLEHLDVSQTKVNIFTKANLGILYGYFKDIYVNLYADDGKYAVPNGFSKDGVLSSDKESAKLLDLIDNMVDTVKIADDGNGNGIISDNNPTLIRDVGGYTITWAVNDETHFDVSGDKLSVKTLSEIANDSLTLTALIHSVYNENDVVTGSKEFGVNTNNVRLADKFINIVADGLSGSTSGLTRGDVFAFDIQITSAQEDGFSQPVKPVNYSIQYSLTGGDILDEADNHRYTVKNSALLSDTATITYTITCAEDTTLDKSYERTIEVVPQTYKITFVANGGTVINESGDPIDYLLLPEETTLQFSATREGYTFCGWYTDESFENPFVEETMPSQDVTLYAQWALSDAYLDFILLDNGTYEIKIKDSIKGKNIVFDGLFPSSYDGKEVTSIGADAFKDCIGLKSIVIPESITSINSTAFCGCSGIESIVVSDGNIRYRSQNNCLYTGTLGVLVLGCKNSSNIPPIAYIGDHAFDGCTGLTSINLSNRSIRSIGNYAFNGCTGLTSISLPNMSYEIKSYAFKGCTNLTSIILNNGNPWGSGYVYNAFSGCSAEIIWGDKPTISIIPAYAFEGYKGTSIIIPDSVKTIGNGAFSGCSELVNINIPEIVTNIGSSAFSGCSSLTSITIPSSVTSIGDRAFMGCGLTSITIPDSVTTIGTGVFQSCAKLTSVTIGKGITSISNWMFAYCSSLSSITIPNNITSIGANAFMESGLTSVTIPNSVTSIASEAFERCSLTSVVIPEGVTSLARWAFNGCPNLTNVTIPESVNLQYIAYSNEIFQGCPIENLTISLKSFNYSIANYFPIENLKTVVITGEGTTLNRTFSGCKSLTSVVIPDDITTIGMQAFSGCTALTSLTIPDSVTTIGEQAFSGCSCEIKWGANPTIKELGYASFNGYSGTSFVIPKSVTSIASYAFCSSGLTSITIPGTIETMGQYVFAYCRSLKNVVIENGVKTIGSAAFEMEGGSSALESITIPSSVTSFEGRTFENCTKLIRINFSGTKTQWNAIHKGNWWNKDTGNYTIYCSNGNISK